MAKPQGAPGGKGPTKPPIAYLVDLFSDEFGEMAPQIVELIKNNLSAGMNPTTAVNAALSQLGVGQRITDSILNKLVAAAAIGFGVEPSAVIDPVGIRKTFLNAHWDGDNLTLSQRVAKAEYRQIIVDTVSAQMRAAASWNKTAQSLTDKNLTLGTLPNYLTNLETAARRMAADNPDGKAEFLKLIKQAQKRVDRLGANGAPNQTLKAIYNEVITAGESLNQKSLDKAISQAVKDKARYNAERIARTEMARAYGAAADLKMLNDTDVIAERIMLSTRHPKYDICNFHTSADLYGMGPGVYPKTSKPPYPFHPHCLCVKVEVYEGEIKLSTTLDPKNGEKYIQSLSTTAQQELMGVAGQEAFKKNPKDWQRYLKGWEGHEPVKIPDGLKVEMFVAPPEAGKLDTGVTLESRLATMEERIRPQRFESAAVFAADGTQILFKDGGATSVSFTEAEVGQMKGAILTHNHPRGWGWPVDDPRRAGNSFSPSDIHLAAKGELAEMRAASPSYNHSMMPGEQGWSLEFHDQVIAPAFKRINQAVYLENFKAIRAGKIPQADAEAAHYHEVWTRVANEIGLIYKREKVAP